MTKPTLPKPAAHFVAHGDVYTADQMQEYAEQARKDYSFTHAQTWLKRINDAVEAERAAMMQLFTDPENQPTQHGTVTVEYMRREIEAEREAMLDLVDGYAKNNTDLRDAILARGRA